MTDRSTKEPVDKDDLKILIETVKEYTTKANDQHEKMSVRLGGVLLIGLTGTLLCVSGSFYFGISGLFYPTALIVGLTVGIALSLVLRQLSEMSRWTIILKRLVQRLSQISDHGNVSFADNIIIDVVLSDAEHTIKKINKV